jgi:hypothetical protein
MPRASLYTLVPGSHCLYRYKQDECPVRHQKAAVQYRGLYLYHIKAIIKDLTPDYNGVDGPKRL